MKMNKQITEDHCSFEIAKLLKEKGFPQDYDKYHGLVYNEKDYEDEYEVQRMVLETRQVKAGTLHSYPLGVPEPKCYCPTHQMALKWLREVHNLHIIVYPWQADNEEKAIHWCCKVYKSFAHLGNDVYTNETPKSYEQAIEAALNYVLKNLI